MPTSSLTTLPLTTCRASPAVRLVAACLLAAAAIALAISGATPVQAILPDSGMFAATPNGVITPKFLTSGVRAYLGIPYAAAPVRELRWRAPQPPARVMIHSADRFAPECIQVMRRHDLNHYFGEEATSEDCLYLNIWV